MRKFYEVLFISLFAVLITLSFGCGQKQESQETDATPQEKMLTISSREDIGVMNPHTYASEMFAQDFVYENLVKYGENGKIEPCLAESWEISPDGKVFTFHLRQGVKFSDGSDFNAEVVKKNYDAVLKVKESHNWLELVNQIEKAEAVDANTFRITFKNPYYPALQELTLIRPMRILGTAGFPVDGDTSENIEKPIGTGPWVLAEHKVGEYAVFTRNENYWGEKPKLDKVIVKVIPDGDTAASALESKEIDMIYGSGALSMDAFKQLQDSGSYQTLISEPMRTRTLGVNSNRGATKELPVRLALQYAIDKQAIIDNVFYGTETKADTLFASNVPYCDLGLEVRNYDLAKAQKLLDDAGWLIPGGKEYREKQGQVLKLDLCFIGGNSIDKAAVQIIQADLKKLGVQVNLVGEESQSFYQRQKDGTFDLIIGETWGAPYDPHSMVSSMREPSHFDYQSQAGLPMKKEIDEKIGQVLVSTDEGARQALYRDILTTLHDQAVYLPISYVTNTAVFQKNVTGVEFATSNEIPLVHVDKE